MEGERSVAGTDVLVTIVEEAVASRGLIPAPSRIVGMGTIPKRSRLKTHRRRAPTTVAQPRGARGCCGAAIILMGLTLGACSREGAERGQSVSQMSRFVDTAVLNGDLPSGFQADALPLEENAIAEAQDSPIVGLLRSAGWIEGYSLKVSSPSFEARGTVHLAERPLQRDAIDVAFSGLIQKLQEDDAWTASEFVAFSTTPDRRCSLATLTHRVDTSRVLPIAICLQFGRRSAGYLTVTGSEFETVMNMASVTMDKLFEKIERWEPNEKSK